MVSADSSCFHALAKLDTFCHLSALFWQKLLFTVQHVDVLKQHVADAGVQAGLFIPSESSSVSLIYVAWEVYNMKPKASDV